MVEASVARRQREIRQLAQAVAYAVNAPDKLDEGAPIPGAQRAASGGEDGHENESEPWWPE